MNRLLYVALKLLSITVDCCFLYIPMSIECSCSNWTVNFFPEIGQKS